MCLGIPMKIVKVQGDTALCELDGVTRSIGIQLVEDVRVGDFVIVHAGYAIEKLDEAIAQEMLALLDEKYSDQRGGTEALRGRS